MLPEEWEVILEELDALREHVRIGKASVQKALASPPVEMEKLALCAHLHGFYTGIEKTMRSVAEFTGDRQSGRKGIEGWHKKLLDSMTNAAQTRPALLSEALEAKLMDYLNFRHVFRMAYTQEMSWSRMRHLLESLDETHEWFVKEVMAFGAATGHGQEWSRPD